MFTCPAFNTPAKYNRPMNALSSCIVVLALYDALY
jgi:hypothetical protein